MAESITDETTSTRAKAAARSDYPPMLWGKCTTLNVQLYQVATRQENHDYPYFVERIFSTIEDIFLDTVSNLKEHLYGLPAGASVSSTSTSSQPMQVPLIKFYDFQAFVSICNSRIILRLYLLPIRRLKIFNGYFLAWQCLFEGCFDGQATQLLKHISTTADNFAIGWKSLSDRFSNKRRIMNLDLSFLFSLKYITRESSPQ